MEKNLHNIDDIFKQAHQNFDEKPSADVWDKLESALDKKDAEKYRRRFIGWKRAAILLFLLFFRKSVIHYRYLLKWYY